MLAVKLYGVQVICEDTVDNSNLRNGIKKHSGSHPHSMLKATVAAAKEITGITRSMNLISNSNKAKAPDTMIKNAFVSTNNSLHGNISIREPEPSSSVHQVSS